jgi:hypothetical protein
MDMSPVLQELTSAKAMVMLAGAAVIGVCIGIKLSEWIESVLIRREADREYYERYGP